MVYLTTIVPSPPAPPGPAFEEVLFLDPLPQPLPPSPTPEPSVPENPAQLSSESVRPPSRSDDRVIAACAVDCESILRPWPGRVSRFEDRIRFQEPLIEGKLVPTNSTFEIHCDGPAWIEVRCDVELHLVLAIYALPGQMEAALEIRCHASLGRRGDTRPDWLHEGSQPGSTVTVEPSNGSEDDGAPTRGREVSSSGSSGFLLQGKFRHHDTALVKRGALLAREFPAQAAGCAKIAVDLELHGR